MSLGCRDRAPHEYCFFRCSGGSFGEGLEVVVLSLYMRPTVGQNVNRNAQLRDSLEGKMSVGEGEMTVLFSWYSNLVSQRLGVTLRVLSVDDRYIRSLCMTNKWDAKGGKSGATFSKTGDERFVVKFISKTELQMFLDCALQ